MPANFEDLDAFQAAVDLTVAIYQSTNRFPQDEQYELRKQLRRAAVSIVSNIAEGQGRLTDGEWRQFLGQARGSLYEVQAQLIVAERLGLIDESTAGTLRSQLIKAAKPLAGLIEYVRHARNPTTDNRELTTHDARQCVVLAGGVSFSVSVGGTGDTGLRVTFFPSAPLLGSGAAGFIPCCAGDCAELVTGWVMAGGLFW